MREAIGRLERFIGRLRNERKALCHMAEGFF